MIPSRECWTEKRVGLWSEIWGILAFDKQVDVTHSNGSVFGTVSLEVNEVETNAEYKLLLSF